VPAVRSPTADVSLDEEIKLQRLYLDIEQIRFPDRLTVEVDVPDALQSARVPVLLLQPVVENAVKYAISPREEGGTISISARVKSGTMHLTVADDGPGLIDPSRLTNGRGVGIRNTR
jgi:LytS/YehU family sensor histidine kinase